MVMVSIVLVESTSIGDVVEALIDKNVEPAVGMMLMDEQSETWEITAALHDTKRITHEDHLKRWTFQCKPLSSDEPIHVGDYKLIH